MIGCDRHLAQSWSRGCDRTPMLIPALSFVAGIIAAGYFGFEFLPAWLWISLSVIFAAMLFFFRRKWLLFILFFLFGSAAYSYSQPQLPPGEYDYSEHERTGVIRRVSRSESSVSALVDMGVDGERQMRVMTVITCETVPQLLAGDKVTFISELEPVKSVRQTDNDVDPVEYYNDKVSAICFISSPSGIVSLERGSGLIARAARICAQAQYEIDRSSLSHSAKDLLKTMLTGDSYAITSPDREIFTAGGVAHLLAVSGLHVGIIAMLASLAMFPLMLWGARRLKVIMTIILVWLYVLFTGASPSVVRAGIMITVFLLSRIMERHSCGLNSLCLACVIVLAVDPEQLVSIGFQLSFASVAAILLFANHLSIASSSTNRFVRAVGSFFGVSLAANLGAGIIAAYYFHTFPVYFLITNAFIGVIAQVFIGAGILLVASLFAGIPYGLLCKVVDLSASIIRYITETTASLPGAMINDIFFPVWTFVPYILLLCLLKMLLVSRNRKYRIGYASVALIIVALTVVGIKIDASKDYPDEWIVTRGKWNSTDIIIRKGEHMRIYTSAPEYAGNSRLENIKKMYSDYARKRKVKDVSLITPADSLYGISTDGYGNLTIGNDSIYVASGSPDMSRIRGRYNYWIVGKDFEPSFSHLYGFLFADTIILRKKIDKLDYHRISIPLIQAFPEDDIFFRKIK